MEIAIFVLVMLGIGWFAVKVPLGLHQLPAKRDMAADYERLGNQYGEASLRPKLCRMIGRPVPPDEEERYRRVQRAYADFMLGLDDEGFTAIAMHLDAKMQKHGGDAPFDHLCEFLHEEIEAIRKDVRAVDPHRFRFALHFIPSDHPAMYIPYRPKQRA